VPVVVVSQAYRNGVDLSLYESGAVALAEGALSGGDMTPSAALVKLMQGLVYYRDRKALAGFIETPTVGEMTERRPLEQQAPAKKSRRTR
jgi:L-asparaginase